MEVEISAVGGVAPGSPLGSALMGAGIGDVVDVEAPSGSWKARVLAIRRARILRAPRARGGPRSSPALARARLAAGTVRGRPRALDAQRDRAASRPWRSEAPLRRRRRGRYVDSGGHRRDDRPRARADAARSRSRRRRGSRSLPSEAALVVSEELTRRRAPRGSSRSPPRRRFGILDAFHNVALCRPTASTPRRGLPGSSGRAQLRRRYVTKAKGVPSSKTWPSR